MYLVGAPVVRHSREGAWQVAAACQAGGRRVGAACEHLRTDIGKMSNIKACLTSRARYVHVRTTVSERAP